MHLASRRLKPGGLEGLNFPEGAIAGLTTTTWIIVSSLKEHAACLNIPMFQCLAAINIPTIGQKQSLCIQEMWNALVVLIVGFQSVALALRQIE